jgi:hypothetical protein
VKELLRYNKYILKKLLFFAGVANFLFEKKNDVNFLRNYLKISIKAIADQLNSRRNETSNNNATLGLYGLRDFRGKTFAHCVFLEYTINCDYE